MRCTRGYDYSPSSFPLCDSPPRAVDRRAMLRETIRRTLIPTLHERNHVVWQDPLLSAHQIRSRIGRITAVRRPAREPRAFVARLGDRCHTHFTDPDIYTARSTHRCQEPFRASKRFSFTCRLPRGKACSCGSHLRGSNRELHACGHWRRPVPPASRRGSGCWVDIRSRFGQAR